MIKIIIVDDEYYFRKSLMVMLPWEELGFTIVGEAKNGEEALEIIDKTKPDIGIIDINMPYLNGLELSMILNDKGYNIKKLFLTGYDNFEFARQSIDIGIEKYILKPVSADDLKNALLKIKEDIENENKKKLEWDDLKIKLTESKPIIRDRILNDIIMGRMQGNNLKNQGKLDYIHLNLKYPIFITAVIEIDDEDEKDWDAESKLLWRFAILNISQEFIEKEYQLEAFQDMTGKICCIVGFFEMNEGIYNKLCNILEGIIGAVRSYLKFSITIGVGSPYKDINNIYMSYNEAIHAIKSKIVTGYSKVIEYSDTKDVNIAENIFTTEQRNRILISMNAGLQDDVLIIIEAVFLKLKESRANVMLSYFKCFEMISICIEYMAENNFDFFQVLNIHGNIIEEIESKKTIDELKNYIEEVFISVINVVADIKDLTKLNLAQKVKTYIDKNITDCELGIDMIVNAFFVNYSHLCRVFKKQNGITINEYITEARMRKAKELMDTGFHIVQYVSEKVGYKDPNYFTKCFRKHYGFPPHKYI